MKGCMNVCVRGDGMFLPQRRKGAKGMMENRDELNRVSREVLDASGSIHKFRSV